MRVVLCNTDENPAREAMYLRLMQEERITGIDLCADAHDGGEARRYGLRLPHRAGRPRRAVGVAGRGGNLQRGSRRAAGRSSRRPGPSSHRRAVRQHLVDGDRAPRRPCGGDGAAWAGDRRLLPAAGGGGGGSRVDASAGGGRAARCGDDVERADAARALSRRPAGRGLQMLRDIAIAGFDNEIWTELVELGGSR